MLFQVTKKYAFNNIFFKDMKREKNMDFQKYIFLESHDEHFYSSADIDKEKTSSLIIS